MKKETSSKKTLKTFNLDEQAYNQFSHHCKTNGISMSKKIENFIKEELSKLNLPIKEEVRQIKEEIKPVKEHSFRKYC